MDLVLMIIAICFRNSNEQRNYNVLIILSLVGIIVTLILFIFVWWMYILDFIWYVIDMALCVNAKNSKN